MQIIPVLEIRKDESKVAVMSASVTMDKYSAYVEDAHVISVNYEGFCWKMTVTYTYIFD